MCIDLELVLCVCGPAKRASLQVARICVNGGVALLLTAHPLQLQTADKLVPAVGGACPLATQAARAVHKILGFESIEQQHIGRSGLVHAVVVARLPQAKTQLQAVIGRQALGPLAIHTGHVVTARVQGLGRVGPHTAFGLLDLHAAQALVIGIHHKRREGERAALLAFPLQAGVGMQGFAVAHRFIEADAVIAGIRSDHRRVFVRPVLVHQRQRHRARQGLGLEVVYPTELGGSFAVFLASGDFQVIGVGLLPFAQHDVDGACNRSRSGFGCWGSQDFDFFNLLGRERVD